MEIESCSESTENRGCIETLEAEKKALANLLDTKVQGALVRSRFQNISDMDAPSSFFSLERKSGQRKSVHSLLSDTGQELTGPDRIRTRPVEFYAALFRSEYGETDSQFDCLRCPRKPTPDRSIIRPCSSCTRRCSRPGKLLALMD